MAGVLPRDLLLVCLVPCNLVSVRFIVSSSDHFEAGDKYIGSVKEGAVIVLDGEAVNSMLLLNFAEHPCHLMEVSIQLTLLVKIHSPLYSLLSNLSQSTTNQMDVAPLVIVIFYHKIL